MEKLEDKRIGLFKIRASMEAKGQSLVIPKESSKYATYLEARKAARKLKLNSKKQYVESFKKDARLVLNPARKYKKDWKGWPDYISSSPRKYETYYEAEIAAKFLNVLSKTEYQNKYKSDRGLVRCPDVKFKDDWKGWGRYLGTEHLKYRTYEDAENAARKLKFNSRRHYVAQYKKDSKLFSSPEKKYEKSWRGWSQYLGLKNRSYQSYTEASIAARKLKIKLASVYAQRRRFDEMLPASPKKEYASEWGGWTEFLGLSVTTYMSIIDASFAASNLSIKKRSGYKKKHKQDPMLPKNPEIDYKKDWVSWPVFLGQKLIEEQASKYYLTLNECSKAAIKLNINTRAEYQIKRGVDRRLHSAPNKHYEKAWSGWKSFLTE